MKTEVVDSVHTANTEALVARFKWQAVDKADEAGDGFIAAEVGDIDAFDRSRGFGQLEHFFEAGQTFFGIDEKDFGLDVLVQLTAVVERFKQVNFVAQTSGLFEFQFFGGIGHFGLHLVEQLLLFAFEEHS